MLFIAGFLSVSMTGECVDKVKGLSGYENYDVKVSGNYQYLYIPETDSIQIVGYTGQEDVVVVPEEIEGKPVTIVYNFNDCFNKYIQVREWPKEVYIPDGVIEIGYFGSCKKLEKIHMPDSVQYIRPYAFDECVNLKEIVLPSGLKEIGEFAFAGCIKIKKVIIPYGVKEIGECAFASCNSLKEVSIPDSVTKIGVEAFSFCKKLSKVKLSDNLKVISEAMFVGCNIKSIRLPKNLTKIDYEAFGTNPLTKITIPSKVTRIEREESI